MTGFDSIEHAEPTPAATLILLRESCPGSLDILMVERGTTLAFAAGALVFPGGRVDPADAIIAADARLIHASSFIDADDAAARIAAVREAIEEAGIAPALDPQPSERSMRRLRAMLGNDNGSFHTWLLETKTRICLDALTPFARWRPNLPGGRHFDTRFYVATAPTTLSPTADGTESASALWISAQSALLDGQAGRRRIVFPTRCILARMERLRSLEEAQADGRRFASTIITPFIARRDDTDWLCIPDDSGYPVTAELLEKAKRF